MKFTVRLPVLPLYENLLNKHANLAYMAKCLAEHHRIDWTPSLDALPPEWEQESIRDFAVSVCEGGEGSVFMEALFNVYNAEKQLKSVTRNKDHYTFTFE